MSELTVQEWKTFLKARIVQEKGKDAEALPVFDRLLAQHPNDPHLQSSRAFALQRLGRAEEAVASRIAARYSVLGNSLTGPADEPDVWITNLKDVLDDADEFEQAGGIAASLVAW